MLLIHLTEGHDGKSILLKRLLACLDGSENAELVLPYARGIAKRFGSEIVLLAVPESDSEQPALNQYLEGVTVALCRRGPSARPIVSGSGPARTAVDLSESEVADVILMASQGRGGLDRALEIGSVAARVMQTAQRPLLLVFLSRRTA